MLRKVIVWTMTCGLCLGHSNAHAWNSFGHRVVAAIAYKQLDAPTRKRVVAAFQGHPALGSELWNKLGPDDDDTPGLNLFLNAATFPDDVRPDHLPDGSIDNRFHKPQWSTDYHRRDHHFINFIFNPPSEMPGPPPGDTDGDIISAYADHLQHVKDLRPAQEDENARRRALSLSWIFHLTGDVHQPLHCAARVSKRHPGAHGDEGGNAVKPFPNPRGTNAFERNLHAYWDDLLGTNVEADAPDLVTAAADDLIRRVPRAAFEPGQIAPASSLKPCALESFGLAVDKCYRPLGAVLDDPEKLERVDLQAGYEASSQEVARTRVALAGYRLAETLKTLFPAESGNGK